MNNTVRHTIAGSIKVNGCKITRGRDDWVISCAGTHIGNKDSYIEAESFASQHLTGVRARVEQLQADLNERQAEKQEEVHEAQHLGIRCTGFDEQGDAIYD